MAGRRRSKLIVEDVGEFVSSDEGQPEQDNSSSSSTVRQRTLSISHSGRFKEQKRRGVLSESVFSQSAVCPRDEDKDRTSRAEDSKQEDARVEANTKYPVTTAQKEQSVADKMTVVFETKL